MPSIANHEELQFMGRWEMVQQKEGQRKKTVDKETL